MSQPVILRGDKTSHGGTVITCSPSIDTLGRGWARVGDLVACPRCKGVFPISQGDPSTLDEGKAVAYQGCKVACGASLISSQVHTIIEPSGVASGAAGGSPAAVLANGFGAIGAGLIAGYQDEPLDDTGQRFRGRFQVLDQSSGEPVAGQAVRVRSPDGQLLSGSTDAEGFTQWVERDASETLAFDLVEPGSA